MRGCWILFSFANRLSAPPLKPINFDSAAACIVDTDYTATSLDIVHTNSLRVARKWLHKHVLASSSTVMVGLDVERAREWYNVDDELKVAAVVQIATPSAALVVQLTKQWGKFSLGCAPAIEEVLESAQVIKVGCGVLDDCFALQHTFGNNNLVAPNRFDLGGLGTELDDEIATRPKGLKAVTAMVLGLKLPKPNTIAKSNWGQMPLKERQVVYAARDAWAAAAVAHRLSVLEADTFGCQAVLEERMWQQLPLNELVPHRQRYEAVRQELRGVKKRLRSLESLRTKQLEQYSSDELLERVRATTSRLHNLEQNLSDAPKELRGPDSLPLPAALCPKP